jgi:hypothetical protein
MPCRDSHATTSATRDKASARSALCVPKTLSELMEQWNRLSYVRCQRLGQQTPLSPGETHKVCFPTKGAQGRR